MCRFASRRPVHRRIDRGTPEFAVRLRGHRTAYRTCGSCLGRFRVFARRCASRLAPQRSSARRWMAAGTSRALACSNSRPRRRRVVTQQATHVPFMRSGVSVAASSVGRARGLSAATAPAARSAAAPGDERERKDGHQCFHASPLLPNGPRCQVEWGDLRRGCVHLGLQSAE